MANEYLITVKKPNFEILTPLSEIKRFPKTIELAGRTCYKSEKLITKESSVNFVKNLIKRGHHSVLEHCSISVRIVGDRAMSHQLVRHRIAAYSQESQRYCDYGKMGLQVIIPPTIGDIKEGTYTRKGSNWIGPIKTEYEQNINSASTKLLVEWLNLVLNSYIFYQILRENKIPAEDARSVLPNATKTEIVTTFNLRQWRHVFIHRGLNLHAQWQIRELMKSILKKFIEILPSVFEDLIV